MTQRGPASPTTDERKTCVSSATPVPSTERVPGRPWTIRLTGHSYRTARSSAALPPAGCRPAPRTLRCCAASPRTPRRPPVRPNASCRVATALLAEAALDASVPLDATAQLRDFLVANLRH